MRHKKLGKTILAIKDIETGKVSMIDFCDMTTALEYQKDIEEKQNTGLEFFFSEKTKHGPQRKKWGYAIRED
jgi:hypothetical protein